MSYLVQNYFNNFQVRNPVLRNPVNHSPPAQLTRVRASQLATGTAPQQAPLINVIDLNNSCLRVTPGYTSTNYYLPSANQLITWLGSQSSGQIANPGYQVAVQPGDVLIVPVLNNAFTGCNITAGQNTTGSLESTGTLFVPGRPTSGNKFGTLSTLVIDFTTVGVSSNGVTGAYVVYGLTGTNAA
jgi:hypothetical protein